MVREDAALAARSTARSGPGDSLGDATLGSSQDDQGGEDGVLESVSLPASPSPLDGLRGLPPPRLAHWQWRDRGRVQDGVHAAFQAFGNALASRVRPGNPGSAYDLSEWNLGKSVRQRLGHPRLAATEHCRPTGKSSVP